jgi:hypothetical protein
MQRWPRCIRWIPAFITFRRGKRGLNPCQFVQFASNPVVFGRFPVVGEHQLLLLMQQILAFPVSFVDTARASDKLRLALFRWNSPCEIESAIILKLNIYG